MTLREMLITPKMAYEFLEGNTHNRTLRQNVVERYARDMKAGQWRLTHQAIAFNAKKVLIDGQHRLWAVIESDTPTRFMVAFDAPDDSVGVIDSGVIRDDLDHLQLGFNADVTKYQTAMAKRLLKANVRGKATPSELHAVIEANADALAFADKCFTRMVRGVTVAPVMAVIARAYRHADHDKLRHFAEVLQDGRVTDAADDPILMLRNFLFERAPRTGNRDQVYAKVERALYAFLHNERLSTLYSASNELFPLPGEQTTTTRIRNSAKKLKTATVGRKLQKRKKVA